MKVYCPDCNKRINVDAEVFMPGDEIICPECESMLTLQKKGKKLIALNNLSFEEEYEEEYGEDEFEEREYN